MDDKAAIRQDSFRNRQVSVNQIITIEKMNDEKPLHGWLLYMDGDRASIRNMYSCIGMPAKDAECPFAWDGISRICSVRKMPSVS